MLQVVACDLPHAGSVCPAMARQLMNSRLPHLLRGISVSRLSSIRIRICRGKGGWVVSITMHTPTRSSIDVASRPPDCIQHRTIINPPDICASWKPICGGLKYQIRIVARARKEAGRQYELQSGQPPAMKSCVLQQRTARFCSMGPFSGPKLRRPEFQPRLRGCPPAATVPAPPPRQPMSSLRLDKRDSTDGAADMDLLSIKLEPKASSVEISD